jgi:alpha/beta hydrolase family protein
MPVIDLKISDRKSYAGGRTFGDAGAYDQIEGVMTFAVDPSHAANEGIIDLDLAPRDRDGCVRFRSDFFLVLPADKQRSNGRLLVELPNRGRKLFGTLNHAVALEGASAAGGDPGDGFLFRHGWSVASVGWQWDVVRNGGLLGFDAPPVLIDGLPVGGQNIVSIRPNYRERTFLLANRVHQPYPARSLDDPRAVLYLRDHELGEDRVVSRESWRFGRETADGSVTPSRDHVYMAAGFEPGKVYNLVYEAEGARVVGAGLLAYRDAAAFLRSQSEVSPGFEQVHAFGISQTGRMLRHFLYLGLNIDESSKQVFDGCLVHVAGARRGEFNHRFAQPSVQLTPGFGNTFPFADDEMPDPFSERRDGLLKRQRERGGVPKVIYTNTSAEYWRGDAALTHVDPGGQSDLEPAPEARIYHFASCQHGAGSLPQKDVNPNEGTRGRYGFNLIDYVPLLRAALLNLDRWASEGVEPPPSCHPRLGDGTLVSHADALAVFKKISDGAVPDTAHLWGVNELDLGANAAEGIGRYPAKIGRPYARLVPDVDADGNDRAGIRLPDLSVPLATNAGWNLRHPETGAPEQVIAMMGQTRFFARKRTERTENGDPRPSLEERYTGKDDFLRRVRDEASKLAAERYILDEDVELLMELASARYDLAVAGV